MTEREMCSSCGAPIVVATPGSTMCETCIGNWETWSADQMARRWWLCPNGECEHGAILHDRYDDEDTRPTCCAEGCTCGH